MQEAVEIKFKVVYWDEEVASVHAHQAATSCFQDDCCQRRCSPARPCSHGGGPCTSHADCLTGGLYYMCGAEDCVTRGHHYQQQANQNSRIKALSLCLGNYYPLDEFPANARIHGFKEGDKCCRRVCHGPDWRWAHDIRGHHNHNIKVRT